MPPAEGGLLRAFSPHARPRMPAPFLRHCCGCYQLHASSPSSLPWVVCSSRGHAPAAVTSGPFAVSQKNKLYFNGMKEGVKYITHGSASCLLDAPEGSVLEDAAGVFVSMKLPHSDRLPQHVYDNLFSTVLQWEEAAAHNLRGGRKASISKKFFCGGLKGDTDSGLAMHHSPQNECTHEKYLSIQNHLRSVLRAEVLSRVQKYAYSLIDLPHDELKAMGLARSFISYLASISCGHLFWNQHHEDDDLWITILVVLGTCTHGGEFAHMGVGWAHVLHPGDILIINPAVAHSTAEVGDPDSNRRIVALFVSVNTIRACATSVSVQREHGLSGGRPKRSR